MRRLVLSAAFLLVAVSPSSLGSHFTDFSGGAWPSDVEPGVPARVEWGFVVLGAHPQGTGDFDLELFVDGAFLERVRVPSVTHGYGVYGASTATFTAAAGVHAFEVRFDAADEVPEFNESNNVVRSEFTFTHDRVDLSLEVLNASAGWPDTTARFAYRVCNEGTAAATGAIEVMLEMRQDNGLRRSRALEFADHAPLAAGACATGEIVLPHRDDRLGEHQYFMAARAPFETIRPRENGDENATGTLWFGPSLPGLG